MLGGIPPTGRPPATICVQQSDRFPMFRIFAKPQTSMYTSLLDPPSRLELLR
jgi:hypothetical protein